MIETDKLIICVAPCRSYPKKGENPYIPFTPEEIAEEVVRAWNEGASLADLHAQSKDKKPTTDPDVIREITRQIRKRGCDIIVEYSPFTGIERAEYVEEGFRILEAKPEMVSVGTQVLVWMKEEQEGLFAWTRFFNEHTF